MDNMNTIKKLHDNVASMYFEQCLKFYYFINFDTMDKIEKKI
jgi:hypothetical protein